MDTGIASIIVASITGISSIVTAIIWGYIPKQRKVQIEKLQKELLDVYIDQYFVNYTFNRLKINELH